MKHFYTLQITFLTLLIFPKIFHCDNTSFLWTSLLDVPPSTFSGALLPPYVNFTEDVLKNEKVSGECRAGVAQALDALSARKLWASALFNSWAKFPPSGTLVGTLVDFGDYDQCLGVETGSDSHGTAYCLVDVALPMPRPMPHQHNYFHRTKGLLPVSKEIDNIIKETANISLKNEQIKIYLENGSVYRHLEQISSVFYYEDIQIGVCWPGNCSQEDVAQVMSKGKE